MYPGNSSLANVPDVDRLPGGVVRNAPHTKQPLRLELVYRPQGIHDGCVVIRGV